MWTRKKILVTGGAGYIGSHTLISLYESGYQPIVVDDFRNSTYSVLDEVEKLIGVKIQLFELDCCDKTKLESVFLAQKLDAVIHFAALKSVSESVSCPSKYYRNNLISLINVVDLMEKYEVHSLVFSSSCTVYGEPDNVEVTEDTMQKVTASPYGYSKQLCERYLEDVMLSGSKLKISVLRYFNPIGAHPSGRIGELPVGIPNNLLPYITQTAAGIRNELTVFGDNYPTPDGTCIRDFIHVMDLADAHVKCISFLDELEFSAKEVFNVGTGKGTSVKKLIDTFQKVNKVSFPIQIGPKRPGDIVKIYANTDKIKNVLHWQSKYSISDAVKHAWNWQLTLMSQIRKVA